MTLYCTHPTPLGIVTMTSDGTSLASLLIDWKSSDGMEWIEQPDLPVFIETARQLDEYFSGSRTSFDLPLGTIGTEFQRRVWTELQKVIYGETTSYGEIAARLGNPNASRAVGLANGRNPLWIVVPCHRIVGASGALTGYAGGLHRKRALLDFEAAISRGEHKSCMMAEPDKLELALF